MAEVKEIRVLAGTFPASCGDQAKKLQAELKAAKMEGFKVEPAKNMPGFIQVAAECKSEEAAAALIKQGREKKFNLCK